MMIMPIGIGHAAELFQLYDALDEVPPTEHPSATGRLADYLQQLCNWPGSAVLGCFDAGRLVGTYSLIVIPLLVHGGRKIGIIESVVVDAEVRGQGIGRQLMTNAAARGRAAGCYKLMLSSNLRRHQAHDFYAQMGFRHHGHSYHLDLDHA